MNDSENSGTPRKIVDTNVIIRFLVGDEEEHAQAAKSLFQCASNGSVTLFILETVFTETVFVLTKYYELPPADIANVLRLMTRLPGVEIQTETTILLRSLDYFETLNVPWPDALIAAYAVESGMPEVYPFDRHFDKFPGVKKLTP